MLPRVTTWYWRPSTEYKLSTLKYKPVNLLVTLRTHTQLVTHVPITSMPLKVLINKLILYLNQSKNKFYHPFYHWPPLFPHFPDCTKHRNSFLPQIWKLICNLIVHLHLPIILPLLPVKVLQTLPNGVYCYKCASSTHPRWTMDNHRWWGVDLVLLQKILVGFTRKPMLVNLLDHVVNVLKVSFICLGLIILPSSVLNMLHLNCLIFIYVFYLDISFYEPSNFWFLF